MDRSSLLLVLLDESSRVLPVGSGLLNALAAELLAEDKKRHLAERLAQRCAADFQSLSHEFSKRPGVWESAAFELSHTLRILPLQPAFAVQHDLDEEKLYAAFLALREPLKQSEDIIRAHDRLLRRFVTHFLNEILPLPETHVAFMRHTLRLLSSHR